VLLREALGVELPAYTAARTESADLSQAVSTEYRADVVVLLVHGEPVFGIVVEVQLSRDEDKRFTWPLYATALRARFRCECCVLVVTASDAIASWASAPIRIGAGNRFTPFVIGPSGVPLVVDPDRARRDPELGVLSAMAHGKGHPETAVTIAGTALMGISGLDEETRVLYFDLIEAALGDAARKALQMIPQGYKFQGPTYLKGEAEGRLKGRAEGKAEGKAEGEAEGRIVAQVGALLDVLEARGIALPSTARARIDACKDAAALRAWIRRAATVARAEDLFED
jgi:hypothetical protein